MALRLPPLSGLRLFEAAARCGSFKQAAQELNLTPGALSHGIDSLEQWLDVNLFERRARGVLLSAAGRQYLPYITEALSMIATGTLRLPSRGFESRLWISSAPLFACKLLLPRLHKFREMYPKMVVTVDAKPEIVQLPSDQVDVAIRTCRDSVQKMSCDLIGRISYAPVGAPGYVRDLCSGGSLDWSRATLVHTVAASDDWQMWCNGSQTDVSAARKLMVGNGQLALEAAASGLGLAIGRLPIIDDDIAAGRLTIASDHVVPVPTGYWLVKPPGVETRREIVAFRNWLLKELSQLDWNRHSEKTAIALSA
jgi:LysR family glycine cleavage system transcriptional activator